MVKGLWFCCGCWRHGDDFRPQQWFSLLQIDGSTCILFYCVTLPDSEINLTCKINGHWGVAEYLQKAAMRSDLRDASTELGCFDCDIEYLLVATRSIQGPFSYNVRIVYKKYSRNVLGSFSVARFSHGFLRVSCSTNGRRFSYPESWHTGRSRVEQPQARARLIGMVIGSPVTRKGPRAQCTALFAAKPNWPWFNINHQ